MSTSANAPIEIMPFWSNTASVTTSLSISSGTANCSITVIGNPGTTKITAVVYLQQKNSNGTFTTVRTWSGISASSSVLTWSGTNAVTSGQTYRLRCDTVVTKSGTNESVTVYSAERKA